MTIYLQQFRVIEPSNGRDHWRATQTDEPIVDRGPTPHDALIDYLEQHKAQD